MKARLLLFTFFILSLTNCTGVQLVQFASQGRAVRIDIWYSIDVQVSTPTPTQTSHPTPTQDVFIPMTQTPTNTPIIANTPIFATNTPFSVSRIVTSPIGVNVRVECGAFYRIVGALGYNASARVTDIVYNDRGEKWYRVSYTDYRGQTVTGCSIASAF